MLESIYYGHDSQVKIVNAEANPTEALLNVITISALTAVVALCFLAFRYPTTQVQSDVLSFRFNPFVMLSLLGILFNGFLLAYINRPKLKTPEAPWFSLYLMMNIIWGIGEAATRLSATPGGAVFWWHFESVGLAFAPCAFFLFAVAYAYQDSFVQHVIPVLTMITLGLLVVYLFLATGVLVDKDPAHVLLTPWGYYPAYAHTYAPFLIWLLAGYAGAMALLISRFRNTRAWPQVKLFVFGALVPLIVGMSSDGILPAFGAFFPPSAVIATAIFAAIVAYVMVRYGLLRLNPRTFAPGLLQTMSEGVIVTDPAFRIEFFNNSAADLLQAAQNNSSLDAKDLLTLFSPLEAERLQMRIFKPLTHSEIAHYDDAMIRTFGDQAIPVSISATKVLDTQSRLTGYSFVFTDLRQIKAAERQLEIEKRSVERKVDQRTLELRQARAELEASIRSLPFGFAIINTQDEVVFSNNQLATLLGREIPTGRAATRAVLSQIGVDYQSAIDLLACIHESQTTSKPIEKNISFGPRFFRFYFAPILGRDDHGKHSNGGVLLVEDTTEAKALERSRDEFFSIASHELRTPLTAVRGNSDMILNYFQEQLKDPSLKEMVVDIHDSSTRLISIVNDFLDMSRLEMGKFAFKTQPFDVGAMIQQVLREYDVTGSRRKLHLAFEPPHIASSAVLADPERSRQILVNLLGNAIKFTEHGGVTVTAIPKGKMMNISVTDTGKGIPIESQHLLFHKFQQASNNILTRDSTQSTGLGLYISRLLAENMGGRLYIEQTEVGKGSTFTLELPLTDQPIPGQSNPGAPPTSKS
jgi:signal transduction histidine kinase